MTQSSPLTHLNAEETEAQRWDPKYPGPESQRLAELERESRSLVSLFIGSFPYVIDLY